MSDTLQERLIKWPSYSVPFAVANGQISTPH